MVEIHRFVERCSTNLCISIILLFFSFEIHSQEKSLELIYTPDEVVQFFTSDQIQNLYLVNDKNEVVKYNAQGIEAFRYNNNTLGELALIDAFDPFNLLLYYPEYMTIVILDRTLNEMHRVNLSDLGYFDVQSIGMASDNNIWIYDELNYALVKIDKDGKALIKSDPLNLILPRTPDIHRINENEQKVYLNDPSLGLLVFDVFGSFEKTIDIKGLNTFQIISPHLIYPENNQW